MNEIRKIASKCRDACEWYVTHANDHRIDCGSAETLRAFCLIAAAFVTETLQRHGYTAHTVTSAKEDHAWTVCGDLHVDVTCKQFGGPRVSVRRRKVATTHFHPAEWAPGQRPTKFRLKKLHSLY